MQTGLWAARSVMKRVIAVVLALVVLALAASLFAGWVLTRPVQTSVGKAPAELNAEAATFPSESGATVHGWWCPVAGSEGAVLLLPGVRANRLSMVDRATFLRRAGYSVLLIDFQATGETEGRQITFGWRESADVLAAVAFMRARQPNAKVAIIGSSLGGAAALLATPPLHVQAIILEAVYPTVERATDNRLRNYLGPIGPLGTPLLLVQLPIRLGVSARQLRPIDHIAYVNCPVLVVNGDEDRRTTREDALLLFGRALAPKQLWLIPDVGHVDVHRAARARYESLVLQFLRASIGRPGMV